MNSEILEIIVKVLSGNASPAEKQRLRTWIGLDNENLAVFQQFEAIWNSFDIIKSEHEYNCEEAFERFKQQIDNRLKKYKKRGFLKKFDVVLRVAAVIIILLGIAYFFLRTEKKPSVSDETISVVTTPKGSKSQVLLPDGSMVWLNSESRIQFTNSDNQADKVVSLEGEGYFEVKEDCLKPFIVVTSGLRIKVLGTTFNVKSYPDDKTVETTLIEGRLELESDVSGQSTKLITLKPNQKVTYFKGSKNIGELRPADTSEIEDSTVKAFTSFQGKIISDEIVDPKIITSWKDNIIYFDDEEFLYLAVRLERSFGVRIHFIDEDLKKLRFTGKFSDLIIEQVLDALQFASPFYYKFDGEDIYLYENPIEESHNIKQR